MGGDNDIGVARPLLRTSSVGYALRAAWTSIAVGALVAITVSGPYRTLFESVWLRVAAVLLVADAMIWLGLLAAQRVRPELGQAGHTSPIITAVLAAGTITPGSVDSNGTRLTTAVVLVALTLYTITAHVLIVRRLHHQGRIFSL